MVGRLTRTSSNSRRWSTFVTPAVPLLSAVVALGTVLWMAPPLPEAVTETPSPVTFEAYEYGEIPAQATTSTERPLGASESVEKASEGRCTQWSAIAAAEGFIEAEIDVLERILWLESRCQPTIVGDEEHGGSYGIAQIHTPTWCKSSKFYPNGYLQTHGIVLTCDDLFDPVLAIRAARAIYIYAGHSFRPWSTYKLIGGEK
jgi:hypothetical protein